MVFIINLKTKRQTYYRSFKKIILSNFVWHYLTKFSHFLKHTPLSFNFLLLSLSFTLPYLSLLEVELCPLKRYVEILISTLPVNMNLFRSSVSVDTRKLR